MELKPGDRVDRYLLVELLGEGGQGSVWRAEDPMLPGQPRAVKLLRLETVRPTDAERVRLEARGLAKLEHPSLVSCHTLFEDMKLGVLGMVLDFVDGRSLGAALNDSRLTDRHRVKALGHVAEALAYVHRAGHVHRDLKLDNVLVTQDFWANPEEPKNVKLVDFGIARFATNLQGGRGLAVLPLKLTQENAIVGTITYIAPELLDPEFFGARDGAAPTLDVFAFGVLAHKLLIGGHPTGLPRGAGLVAYGAAYRLAAESDRPWPPGLPASAWGELLAGSLALRPENRIRDGAELARRVEQAGEFAHVIRTTGPFDSNPRQSPTSVASPGAMQGATAQIGPIAKSAAQKPAEQGPELDPTLLASVAPPPRAPSSPSPTGPQPAPRAPSPPARGPEASRSQPKAGMLGTIAVVVVVALAFAFVYKLVATPDDKPPPAPLIPIALGSEPIALATSPPSAPDAELDVTDLDAVPEASLPNLPAGCSPTSTLCECCPSASDCGGACNDLLEADEKFHLRLGAVVPRAGVALGDVMVCAHTLRSPSNTCTHAASVLGAAIPTAKLYVETSDFLMGIEIEVFGAHTEASSVARARIKENPKRLALCQGIEVSFGEGPVEKARFYLDPPGPPPVRRCISD